MTSPCAEGMAPWPPGPVRVMRNELASDMAMPGAQGDEARGQLGGDVEPDQARPLHGGQRPAFEHRLGPAQRLLGRLEEEDVAARQVLAAGRQQRGRAEQGGHVDVVAAGVHDALDLGVDRAGLVLLYGQAVDVAPQHDAAPGPAALHGEDAARLGGAQRLGDAERRHVVADQGRRLVLGEGQLGPAVQRAPLVDHVVEHGVGRGRAEQVASRHRLSRSRAMWVTWISSVPA